MELAVNALFYLISFVTISLLFFFGGKYQKKWCIVIGLGLIILISAFRYRTGIDYVNYENIKTRLASLPMTEFITSTLSQQFEFGLYIISLASTTFQLSNVVFFGIYSIISILFYYFGIKKCVPSKYIWFGILLYLLLFFAPSLNGVRQFSAISIVFYATITYLKSTSSFRRRLISFLLLTVLASLIHSSSIIFVFSPLLFWCSDRLSHRPFPSIFFWSFLGTSIVIAVEFFIVKNIEFIPVLNKYSYYLSWSMKDAPIPNLIPKIFPIIFSTFVLTKSKHNKDTVLYYVYCLIAFATSLLGLLIPYGYRLSDFFFIFQIPLFINLINNISQKDKRQILLYAIIFYGLIYFIYSTVINNSHGIIPYQFIPLFY